MSAAEYYNGQDADSLSNNHSNYRSHRDTSPDRRHGGGSPYASGALPSPRARSRGGDFEEHTPFYALGPASNNLAVPSHHARPRSVPPPQRDRHARDDDGNNSDWDPDDPHKGAHSPLGRAKHVLHHTFSQSTSGLGVGVLGAIVGGLSAREASLAASRRGGHHRGGDESNKAALLSTIVGAAVGGLGANALEKRIESSRKKNKDEQDAWERKWGRARDLLPEPLSRGGDRDRDRDRDRDHRGRDNGPARSRDRDHRDRDRGAPRRDRSPADGYSSDDDSYTRDDRRAPRRSGSRYRN